MERHRGGLRKAQLGVAEEAPLAAGADRHVGPRHEERWPEHAKWPEHSHVEALLVGAHGQATAKRQASLQMAGLEPPALAPEGLALRIGLRQRRPTSQAAEHYGLHSDEGDDREGCNDNELGGPGRGMLKRVHAAASLAAACA